MCISQGTIFLSLCAVFVQVIHVQCALILMDSNWILFLFSFVVVLKWWLLFKQKRHLVLIKTLRQRWCSRFFETYCKTVSANASTTFSSALEGPMAICEKTFKWKHYVMPFSLNVKIDVALTVLACIFLKYLLQIRKIKQALLISMCTSLVFYSIDIWTVT